MRNLSKYLLLTIFSLALGSLTFANTSDSLERYILESEGIKKIDAVLLLGGTYQNSDYEKALVYAREALELSEKNNYQYGIAMAKNNIGYSLTDLGNYDEAIDYYQQSIVLFKQLKEENKEAIAYNDLAYIFQVQGMVKQAIHYYIKSLKLLEKFEDKQSVAACLNNIGSLYQDINDNSKALEYYSKSLETRKTINDEKGIALCLNNIGSLYFEDSDLINAKEYFFKSLVKRKKLKDSHGIAQSLTNIAALYRKQKDHETALEYLKQAEKIQIEMDDQIGLTNTINSIGMNYSFLNDLSNAKKYLEKAYEMSHQIGSTFQIKHSALALSNLYRLTNQYEKAYPLLIEHYKISDSLENTANTRKLTQVGLQYEFEKKLNENELEQVKRNLKNDLAIKEQKIVSISFAAGLGILAVLFFVILKSLNDKKKANKRITQQNIEIEEKSHELGEALESITDSVKYAKRIQQALLQEEKHVNKKVPEHFILFKPKDIVSGDFYWSLEKGDYFYIAAVDCTGHGVPGALMSMLGISFLNSISAPHETLAPNTILDQLRDKVIEELSQSNKDWSSRDGMDISLSRINLKTNEVEWAGANNPLWIVEENNIREIKGDRQAINYSENATPFSNHKVKLNKGDQIYMFSDGYADQFGGPKGKKFMLKKFKELTLSLSTKAISKQKEELELAFNNWKENLEQIDDVCVIGVKI